MALVNAVVRRRWAVALGSVATLGLLGTGVWLAHESELRQQGEAMFQGKVLLPANLAGQEMILPVQASRCINCHGTVQKNPWIDPSVSQPPAEQTFASPINGAWLKQARMRHGGPESKYDQPALCKLLREGVDPGHVMISTTMPRYNLTDAQCAALWAYLSTK